jgi:hypothetical protein
MAGGKLEAIYCLNYRYLTSLNSGIWQSGSMRPFLLLNKKVCAGRLKQQSVNLNPFVCT